MSGGDDLERRYRRLLAWYPWSHRRVYEDEMLGVLLHAARPGQRRPTVSEAANLMVSGLRARTRAAVEGFVDPAWADAAAVVGLLSALALLAHRGDRLLENVGHGPFPLVGLTDYLVTAGWGAVVVATLVGLRWPAAVLAWATVFAEAILLGRHYGPDPVPTVNAFWLVALGLVAAVALTVPAPPRRAYSVLGARRFLALVLGLSAIEAVIVANRLARSAPDDLWAGTTYVFYGLESASDAVLWLWMAAIAAGGLCVALAVLTLTASVRRRVFVLLAPAAVLAATVELTLGGWSYSNGHMGHPVYLVPVQWVLLVAGPMASLALGVLLVRRRELTIRLAALGRTVDREWPAS